MKSLTLVIELEYDDEIMHHDDQEARDWFYNNILLGRGGLLLHSNEIGDTIGSVTVADIVEQQGGEQ